MKLPKINKKIIISAVVALFIICLAVLCIAKKDVVIPGFHSDENGTWYIKFPLVKAKEFVNVNGEMYYFESYGNNYMRHGWIKYDGFYYYADADGKIVYGEYEIDGEMYNFNEDTGKLYKDNAYILDGKLWYFDSHGYKYYGIVELNGDKFCFSEKGNLYTGLKCIDGKYYYFDPDNEQMVYGLKTVGGATYFFNADTGEAFVGEKIINGTTYVFGEDGKRIIENEEEE